MGGEKWPDLLKTASARGSPPRGRGKATRGGLLLRSKGITPAWAGKSIQQIITQVGYEDHPRVGGEKGLGFPALLTREGSPPRGRGKGRPCPAWCLSIGITPAWAGKSPERPGTSGGYGDHPRVGGEKERLAHCAEWAEGSPPRGRGKASISIPAPGGAGITPAWAGKSWEEWRLRFR